MNPLAVTTLFIALALVLAYRKALPIPLIAVLLVAGMWGAWDSEYATPQMAHESLYLSLGGELAPVPMSPVLPPPTPAPALEAPQAVQVVYEPPRAPSIVPEQLARWSSIVRHASEEYGVEESVLYAIMDIESDGNPSAGSSAGATGLMQVMPRETGFPERPTRAELLDPLTNVRWAAEHLAYLTQRYGQYDAFRRYYGLGGSKTGWYAGEATRLSKLYATPDPAPEPTSVPMALLASTSGTFPATPLVPMPATFKGFGVAVDYQARGKHTGIDVANPTENGQQPPIYAVGNGTVTHVGPLYCDTANACRGSKAIVIDHGGNVYSVYSHNSAATVAAGEQVAAGQEIGRQGNEGYSFGSHLHFEIHTGAPYSGNWQEPFRGGTFEDPLLWLPQLVR